MLFEALTSILSVICVLSVLSKEVLVKKLLLHMTYLRVQHHCVEIHERSLFENDCIMNGFCGVLSPCGFLPERQVSELRQDL